MVIIKIANIMRKILSLTTSSNNNNNVFEKIAREHNCYEKYQNLNDDLKDLIEKCLSPYTKSRLTPDDILKSKLFDDKHDSLKFSIDIEGKSLISSELLLHCCPLEQIYYLWQLAGGDVQAELKKKV